VIAAKDVLSFTTTGENRRQTAALARSGQGDCFSTAEKRTSFHRLKSQHFLPKSGSPNLARQSRHDWILSLLSAPLVLA
jgi:hypothetical protein